MLMADIERLSLSIQKSGRLSVQSQELLYFSGLKFASNNGNGLLFSPVERFPMRVYFDRDDDIPLNVESGKSNFGIVGQNVVWESRASVVELLKLGFGKCRLVLAASPERVPDFATVTQGIEVATSYANMTTDWFGKNGIPVDILERSGSIEGYTQRGSQAIVDLTATGKSLAENGLRILSVIAKSEAVLIADPRLKEVKGSERITRSLIRRILSVKRAEGKTYIALNAPESSLNDIADRIPGETSPTVSRLDKIGWVAVSAVVPTDELDEIGDDLQQMGAEKILDLGLRRIFPDKDDPEVIEALAKIYE